ncbi:hypothetical protein [Halomicrococcus sp. SG-WS-1]|uniref:hypothetical protein n=1 Tax=Halomicrococcus sp. SG-WS-1 TaxID=3439057 RepID=UPI003F7950E0
MTRPLRPATKLAGLFASVAIAVSLVGIAGGFDAAPALWREAWPLAAAVEFGLATLVGYYVYQSGGPKI